jgi:hypothetical protein
MSSRIVKHSVPLLRRRAVGSPPWRVFLVTFPATRCALLIAPFGHEARASIEPGDLERLERLAGEVTRPLRPGEVPLVSDDQVFDYLRTKMSEPLRVDEYVAGA